MTRILTIIALLFATPAWAQGFDSYNKSFNQDPDCKKLNTNISTEIGECTTHPDNCRKWRYQQKIRIRKEKEACEAWGFKSYEKCLIAEKNCEVLRAKLFTPYWLQNGETTGNCRAEMVRLECDKIPRAPRYSSSNSYDDLQDRVDDLEGEVRRLRERLGE